MSRRMLSTDVKSSEDLSRFIAEMHDDLIANPDDWENYQFSSFVEAMSACVHDMDGYYKNTGQEYSGEPTWKIFADILAAARIYE